MAFERENNKFCSISASLMFLVLSVWSRWDNAGMAEKVLQATGLYLEF